MMEQMFGHSQSQKQLFIGPNAKLEASSVDGNSDDVVPAL